ncbi:MAG: hypothetical protein H6727_12070 [Myxococcales bacterium]|nr:hypothetical protein [Myxococcales bacterium]
MRHGWRWLFFAYISFLGLPTPQGYAEDTQARVQLFPSRVLLGQPFVYRLSIKLPPRTKAKLPASSVFLPAMLHGKVRHSQLSSSEIQWRIPLAIFQVREFGEITLPAWRVQLQSSDGTETTQLVPAVKVHVAAQFKEGQRFQHADDPTWKFLPKPETQRPSTEWRFAGFKLPEPPANRTFLWAALAVLGLILATLLVMWLRRRPPPPVPTPPSPLELAQEALQKLNFPPNQDAERVGRFFQALSKIIRTFLQDRTQVPLLFLTTTELRLLFQESWGTPAWSEAFLAWQMGLDLVRFSGSLPETSEIPQAKERARRLLLEIERWQQEQESIALVLEETSTPAMAG